MKRDANNILRELGRLAAQTHNAMSIPANAWIVTPS